MEVILREQATRILSDIGDYYMDKLSPILGGCQSEYFKITSMSPNNLGELQNIVRLCDYYSNKRTDKIEIDEEISNKVNTMIDNTITFLKKVMVRETAQKITEEVIGDRND